MGWPVYMKQKVSFSEPIPLTSGGTGVNVNSNEALCEALKVVKSTGDTMSGSLIVNNTIKGEIFQTKEEGVLAYENNGVGKIDLGNTNFGNWKTLCINDQGQLTLSNNLIYSDGQTILYSETQPATAVKGMIWLKPI